MFRKRACVLYHCSSRLSGAKRQKGLYPSPPRIAYSKSYREEIRESSQQTDCVQGCYQGRRLGQKGKCGEIR